MHVEVTSDAATFDAAAGEFLRADPVANTILVAALPALLAGGSYGDAAATFVWASDGGQTVGAALHTPPHLVALADMAPAVAAELARGLLDSGLTAADLPGAVGRPAAVEAFARAAGMTPAVRLREVQHRLDAVTPPPPVPGEMRALTDADVDTFVRWCAWFDADVGAGRHTDAFRVLDNRRRGGGEFWLWWDGGVPVCLTGVTGAVEGVVRIGPVFTPRRHRGRGYAAALTATVCAATLAAGGRACTLFADTENPTANGVYQRIGFHPVGQIVEATFTP